MKKKILIITLAVFLLAILIIGVVMLSSGNHTHVYSSDCDSTCNKCDYIREASHVYDNDCDIYCNICVEAREVAPHQYDNDYDISCNICGKIREVSHEHSYYNVCDDTCNECGAIRVVVGHVYVGDCDRDCENCYGVREAGEHTYDNNCDSVCNICQFEREVTHEYINNCDKTCELCFAEREALHSYNGPCDEICVSCGAIRNISHSYYNACDAICDLCGFEREVSGHQYDDENDRICNICGANIREDHVHTFKYNCSDSCETCGYTRSGVGHVYDNAEDMYCNYCNFSRFQQHTCVYSNTCDTTCNVCGKERDIEHTYSDSADAICNICGFEREAGHMCTFATPCSLYCGICGASNLYVKHNFVNKRCTICGVFDRCKQNCTFDDNCDTTCDICGYTRNVAHVYENGVCTRCGHIEVIICDHNYPGVCYDACTYCGEKRIAPHQYVSDCDIQCECCPSVRTTNVAHTDGNKDALCDLCDELFNLDTTDNQRVENFIKYFNNYLKTITNKSNIITLENKGFRNIKFTGNIEDSLKLRYQEVQFFDDYIHYITEVEPNLKPGDEFEGYLNKYVFLGENSYSVEEIEKDAFVVTPILNATLGLTELTIRDIVWDESSDTLIIKENYIDNLFYELYNSSWDHQLNITDDYYVSFSNIYTVSLNSTSECSVKIDNNGIPTSYKVVMTNKSGNVLFKNEYSTSITGTNISFMIDSHEDITFNLSLTNSKLTCNITQSGFNDINIGITADVYSATRYGEGFNEVFEQFSREYNTTYANEKYSSILNITDTCDRIYLYDADLKQYITLEMNFKGQFYAHDFIRESWLDPNGCIAMLNADGKTITIINHKH